MTAANWAENWAVLMAAWRVAMKAGWTADCSVGSMAGDWAESLVGLMVGQTVEMKVGN